MKQTRRHAGYLFWFRWDLLSKAGYEWYGNYAYKSIFEALREADGSGEFFFFDGDCLPKKTLQIPYNRYDQAERTCLENISRNGSEKYYVVAVYGSDNTLRRLQRHLADHKPIGYEGKTTLQDCLPEEFYLVIEQMSLVPSLYIQGREIKRISFAFLTDEELTSFGYQPGDYVDETASDPDPNLPAVSAAGLPLEAPSRKYPAPDKAARDYELSQNLLGKTILGRYQVFEVKPGGMGIMLFVEDPYSQKEYAVKTINMLEENRAKAEETLRREINFWINLPSHPNIVQAYSVEVQPPYLYLFMEYVKGENLRDWINRLSFEQTINFAYQICAGMAAANEKQPVVHGDLKPENILISRDGVVKITDFGLSQSFQAVGVFPRISAGTCRYMSLEQLQGRVVDERSDIYSFGIILYEMLTGESPYNFDVDSLGDDKERWRHHFETCLADERLYYTDHWQEALWKEHPVLESRGVRSLVLSCLFPYPANRWMNFVEIANRISLAYGAILREYRLDISQTMDPAQRADALMKIGKFEEALGIYNSLLNKSPDRAGLWLSAAEALANLGMTDTALDFVNQAVAIKPDVKVESSILNRLLSRR